MIHGTLLYTYAYTSALTHADAPVKYHKVLQKKVQKTFLLIKIFVTLPQNLKYKAS